MNFTINTIPPLIVQSMIDTNIWQANCPIPINRLKLLEISHYNFDNKISNGQLIVLDKLAQSALDIFKELFILKFPIHSIKLMDEFHGDDNLSMNANNSSCFNFRAIANTTKLSMHSYGLAIDINPIQNPCIITDNNNILPLEGSKFLNRSNQTAGMVEPIVDIFAKHGFSEWGGKWTNPIDYHHFQVPRNLVDQLILP